MNEISKLNNNENCLIYGLDADLIMLSLLNKNADNIVLIRDNSFHKNEKQQSIDYLEIKTLKSYIIKDLVQNIPGANPERLLVDYIVLCFMLGNDFLDHLPNLSINTGGIDTVVKAYRNAWKNEHLLTENYKINFVLLKDIFYQLKNHESFYFKKFRLNTLALDEIPVLEQIIESGNVIFYKQDYIKFLEEDYKKRYHLYYSLDNLDEICFNYIEGLQWTIEYYKGHLHRNWNWCFNFHAVPFASDLFEYLRTHPHLTEINIYKTCPFSCTKQLLMVLPKKSLMNLDLMI